MSELKVPQIPHEVFNSWPKEAQAHIEALQKLVETLLVQNQQLLDRLNQNSQNSSSPPSQDPPFKRPAKKTKAKSGRPKGAQVGHAKHQRSIVPSEQVDHLIEVRPSHCANVACRTPFKASDQLGQPVRHQVWEIPSLKAQVSEYQFYTYECSMCQTLSLPAWPIDVPHGHFGPHLVATLAVLHGQYQLSLRQVQELAHDVWQLPLSVGGIADACHKTSQALKPTYQQLHQHIQQAPTLHLDETGWYRSGKLKWLWVAVAPGATLFRISGGRGQAHLKELIGSNYAGLAHSDRLRTYLALDAKRHQLCWAHLIRNLAGLAQRASPAKEWAESMLEVSEKLFKVWHSFLQDQGDLEREWLVGQVAPLRAQFKAGLERGLTLGDGKVRAFCRELSGLEERLYLFVKEEGVTPTNNRAEQALRPAVIWRKKCYGNHSEWGEAFVERMLSVRATCQQAKRNVLSFVKECLVAKWFSQPAPVLSL